MSKKKRSIFNFKKKSNSRVIDVVSKAKNGLPKRGRGVGSVFANFVALVKKNRKLIIGVSVGLFFLGVFVAIALGFWVVDLYGKAPNVKDQALNISEGSIIYDRNNLELFRFDEASKKREYRSIDQIPDQMRGAVIALEDENYYNNSVGIPWQNIVGATLKCTFTGGSNCRGGSGLSQQLIKNVTNNQDATFSRKLTELLTAIKFNQDIGQTENQKQDKVLELYLNWVGFGGGNYGVQTASEYYFGKPADQNLSLPESCYLASMVQKPSVFNQAIQTEISNRKNPEDAILNPRWDELQIRKNICLEKMFKLDLKNYGKEKFISSSTDLESLKSEKVTFAEVKTDNLSYGHLRNYLVDELVVKMNISETELNTAGYKIYTTFDKNIQDQTQTTIANSYDKSLKPNGANNASAVILDGNSELIAMVGSRDFANNEIAGQVNVATSPRQPGSSYKPYGYLASFENGFNPGTVLADSLTDFGNYKPQNYSRTTVGPVSIRDSLANSFNIPAIKAGFLANGQSNTADSNLAVANILKVSKTAGVDHPFEDKCTISMMLGTCEVTLLSNANGYNTILHEGNFKEVRPFKKILLKDEDIFAQIQSQSKVYGEKQAALDPLLSKEVTNILSDYNARRSNVWGTCKKNFELDGWSGENSVAAKTGTTDNIKDLLAMGGSPYYTVGVWMGNTDGKIMSSKATSCTTASIWKSVMTDLHKDLPKKGFDRSGLVATTLDSQTGLLPLDGSTTTRVELLSPAQVNILKQAQDRISKSDYDPKANTIFFNRTSILKRKVKVLADDQTKLAPTDQDLANIQVPENTFAEIICVDSVAEYPQLKNWYEPAKDLTFEGLKTCPTDRVGVETLKLGPKITANFGLDQKLPQQLIFTATASNSANTILSMEVYINGKIEASNSNKSTITLDLSGGDYTGKKDILVKAIDSKNNTGTLEIKQADFGVASSSSSSTRSSSSSSSSSKSSSSTSSSSASSSASSSSGL